MLGLLGLASLTIGMATGQGLQTNSPSASTSIAAGLSNPGAWAIQGNGGFLLGITEPGDYDEIADLGWTVIASAQHLALAYENYDTFGGERVSDWTLGISTGDARDAAGISYKWNGQTGMDNRINLGLVHRERLWAAGLATDFQDDFEDFRVQGDAGVRPFGPRLTLFAEGQYLFDEPVGSDELNFGFGAEVFAAPGLSLSAKYFTEGAVSVGVRYSLGGKSRSSMIGHFAQDANDDYKHAGTTFVSEIGGSFSSLPFAVLGQKYPEIQLRGDLPYRRFAWFDDGRTFLGLMREIEAYAQNPKTEGLVLNLSSFRTDPARVLELRDQLAGLRAQGKKVVIYIDRSGIVGYMLASVADELWIDPEGMIDLRGLAYNTSYLAGTLDKIGVGFQEFRYFKYKSAMEIFSRETMSEGQYEQIDALLEDWYETMLAHAITSRGLDRETWDRAVEDHGGLMPTEALEMGFVDKIGDWNDLKEGVDEIERRDTPDLSATHLAALGGDPVWRHEQWGIAPKIALLYAEGVCAMDDGIKGRLLSEEIRKVREDESVKAVVLRADSPGGDPLPSDLVARELKLTMEEKPVIVSQGFVAGSGGYWISMHSDEIVATPLTITGSIGVISGHFWDAELSEKLGTNYQGIKRGSHSDLGGGSGIPFLASLPHRPYDEKELARVEEVIKTLYQDFLEQVAEGRGLTVPEVAEIAQGRVWSGIDGKEIGLVDELGGLWLALQMAKDAAGIEPGLPVQIVEGPGLGRFDFSSLTPNLLGIDTETVGTIANPLSRFLSERELNYVEILHEHDGAPIIMLPPFEVVDGGEVH